MIAVALQLSKLFTVPQFKVKLGFTKMVSLWRDFLLWKTSRTLLITTFGNGILVLIDENFNLRFILNRYPQIFLQRPWTCFTSHIFSYDQNFDCLILKWLPVNESHSKLTLPSRDFAIYLTVPKWVFKMK